KHIDEHFYTDQAGEQEYICQNCGAKIITNKETTATKCSFCGSAVVLSDQLTGSYKPAKVIPFRITKAEAEAAFKQWSKKLLFAPNDFKNDVRIRELTGIYVPFWLCHLAGQGEALADATITHRYSRGDDEVIETAHFNVYRKVDTRFENVPFDASEKMADDLMDKLEPFDYGELYDFDSPYLAGYLAEKYDFTVKDMKERIDKRMKNYVDDYVRASMTGYDSINIIDRDYNIISQKENYTMLPVWMVYSGYQNSEYIFAMNGQTGKIAGNPPVDKGKVALASVGVTLLIFFILRLITFLLGGPIL
ncbi:MAG: hypothetical protein K6F00_08560, partial [Lachnospiraceae bacterium]|nr:hypothetical protein [Lachnospiraceae bacterium]